MKSLLAVLASSLLLTGIAEAQLLAPNAAGVTMGHVHLNVKSVDAQKKFWIDQFAATPLTKEGLQGVKVPGMLILFTQHEPSGGSEGTIVDHFGFKVHDLAEFLKSCRDNGVQVMSEFKGTEGFPNAYLMGPDGVKVELQEDTSLPVRAAAHHLHYYVKDWSPLRDWYGKAFGAQPRKRGQLDTTDIASMNLTFSPIREETPRPATKGRALDHVGFEVKNLEAFCERLEANGIKLDVPYRKVPALGIAIAFLTDPAGTYIELTEGLDTL